MRLSQRMGWVLTAALALATVALLRPVWAQNRPPGDLDETLQCANLVYAVNKSSTCFSDKFLSTVARETNLRPEKKFKTQKLAADDLYNYPFAVMTGEGSFRLTDPERKNLRAYLERGGFLLASASCSSREWDKSFREEVKRIFPEYPLKKLEMDHPIFHTVYDINQIKLSHGGKAQLQGMEIGGVIVMIYSSEGLNNTANVNGCCCCGGNEIENCLEFNVNIFTYAVTH